MTTNPPRRRRVTDIKNLTVGQEYWAVPKYPAEGRRSRQEHKMTIRAKIPGGYTVYAHGFERANQRRTFETIHRVWDVYELKAPPKSLETEENEIGAAIIDSTPTDNLVRVRIGDGSVWTSSTVVAAAFGKRHDDVLKKVRNLECSTDFRSRNFAEAWRVVEHGATKQKQRFYRFTRDGFCMVVFGFTGAKAVAWKEKFLAAFNAMEAELRKRQGPEYAVAGQTAAIETALKEHRRELVTAVAEIVKDGLANNIYQTPSAWLEDNGIVATNIGKLIFESWVDFRCAELGIGGHLNEYTPEVLSGRYDEIAGAAGLSRLCDHYRPGDVWVENKLRSMAVNRVARNKFACEVENGLK